MCADLRFERIIERIVLDLLLLRLFADQGQSVAVLAAIAHAAEQADTAGACELLEHWVGGRTAQ